MNLTFMDIPDDPADLAGWLERRLAGLDLAALVAELAAVHGGAGAAPSLDELLGGHRDAVLRGGLGALPRDRLGQLLRHPACLPELQELVLTAGGPHWDLLTRETAELSEVARRGERRLSAFLGGPAVQASEERRAVRPTAPWYRRPWVVSLATAAAVLVVVYSVPVLRPPAPPPGTGAVAVVPTPAAPEGWGWGRTGAIVQEGGPAAYLNKLADAAGEWFNKRPEESAALAKRVGEMRQGCSALIFAAHQPLSDEDRRWLVGRCRGWAAQLDRQQEALEAGRPIAVVRAEADATVRQIVEVLKTRAEGL